MSRHSSSRSGSGLSARIDKYGGGAKRRRRSSNPKPGGSLVSRVAAYEAKDRSRQVRRKRKEAHDADPFRTQETKRHPAAHAAKSAARQYLEWRGLRKRAHRVEGEFKRDKPHIK
jgi:hypothetical protein